MGQSTNSAPLSHDIKLGLSISICIVEKWAAVVCPHNYRAVFAVHKPSSDALSLQKATVNEVKSSRKIESILRSGNKAAMASSTTVPPMKEHDETPMLRIV
mmetsp:Transcript_3158/g.7225  ORF Transcript_3158/g.7225 Transcript_3158/m.7225 type:complete len:101 (-) Transcript_3158:46-348(-)